MATCALTKVSSSTTIAIPPMTTPSAARPRGMPMPVITRTSGADSAAISRATMTGSTMTENIARALSTTRPAATMTRKRHDQAAARSSPHGTCARLKFDEPPPTVAGAGVRSRRIAARDSASRSRSWLSRDSCSSLPRVWGGLLRLVWHGHRLVARSGRPMHPAGSCSGRTPRRGCSSASSPIAASA